MKSKMKGRVAKYGLLIMGDDTHALVGVGDMASRATPTMSDIASILKEVIIYTNRVRISNRMKMIFESDD